MWIQEDTPQQQWADLAAQQLEGLGLKAFSLLSHAAFIWPIAVCATKRLWFPATMIFIAAVVSFQYHTCLAFDVHIVLVPSHKERPWL